MNKCVIEFINTCPCCDGYGDVLKELAQTFPQEIELRLYYVGKDFDYIPKYGLISRGTMIINGNERYEDLSRRTIERIVRKAVGAAE